MPHLACGKRRGTEALAASLITRRRPRRPSLAYAALPLSVLCHLLYLCMYIYAVLYLRYSHTLSTTAQSEEVSSDPLQLHHHQQQHPSHIHRALPYPLSLSRRMRLTSLYVAISQYRVCTVLYVPYRAVGVSICKSTNRHMLARPTEPASGLRHCSVWLWLVHSAGQASGALPSISCSPPSAPFAAQTRSTALLLLAPETGRGRIARNERARLASVCKASRALARGGAVAKQPLLAAESAQSSERHVSRCPEACACHGPRKELEQREGSYRRVWVCE